MLHEILLSLWGCSTSVSQMIEADSIDLDKYLHPGEQALLNKILDIVKECNVIRNFIHTVNSEDTKEVLPGLYICALCDGMDQALEPFREEIIELEHTVLNDSYTPLSLILCNIEKYTCLFSLLHSIIREIRTQKLHGSKLLQCLHQHMHTGIPEISSTLELMTHSVHIVFYKHLTSWLLYGHLEDAHREFFIQKTLDCEKTLVHEDVKNDIETRDQLANNSKNIDVNMWDYDVQMDMLPSYIKPSLANKILTIGQTVIMFGNDPRQKKDFSTMSKSKNSIWGDKEYEYFRKLQNLQATSNIVEFDRTINELKQCVTELLWNVAVEEAQLMQQLRLVKEFFLMGRGDLFLEFIKLTAHILNKALTSHTSRDINLAFQIALRKMHLNDESAIDSFNFAVPMPPTENEDVDTDTTDLLNNERQDPNEKRGWGLITLKYKVVWPLHLLFSPVVLNDYNILFRFLLRVKKTRIDLWNLWSEHMHHKNVDIGVIQLRNNLVFIVDNLQYYLQVDVLESQYAVMEASMKCTRNFEDIQKAHSVFLANVMSQTFLLGNEAGKKNSVNMLIHLLLRLCDDFILQASMWEVGNLLPTEKEELKTLCETLDSVMNWLTKH
ncbi:gamma-tubulin complex component 4-like [Anoplolepis gracilipes]|uniref:gamma-tubulin complex component 4-like n=1 Tax=Anoplolepis gracilipes TaxID=354296 RepID=UPI003B9F2325